MAHSIAEKTNRKIGALDFVHLQRLQGEEAWRISDIESFRDGLSDALYGDDFDQELGVYDRQFQSQDDAYDFARQLLDTHMPRKPLPAVTPSVVERPDSAHRPAASEMVDREGLDFVKNNGAVLERCDQLGSYPPHRSRGDSWTAMSSCNVNCEVVP